MTIGREVRRLVGAAVVAVSMTTGSTRAQQAVPPDSLWALAGRATAQQCYDAGAYLYNRVAVAERWAPARSAAYYKSAGCHARLGNTILAMTALKDAQLPWTAAENMHHDSDLARLRTEPEFIEFLRVLNEEARRHQNPDKVRFITSDINLFWQTYTKVNWKNKAASSQAFRKNYFDKGSAALQEFYRLEIKSTDALVNTLVAKPVFYRTIRPNTQQLASLTPEVVAGFRKLLELYPAAQFPDVYYVMGRFSVGGMASTQGLVIGVEMQCRTPETPVYELSGWEKNNFGSLDNMPTRVSHELIRFLQRKGSPDQSLLRGALDEGMADFLAELMTGTNANARLQVYAATRERKIWADFKKEISSRYWRNWLRNADQEAASKPANLGAYIGYQICKAYYESMADHKQAVHDMLNITDYSAFLKKSGYDGKVVTR